jgi:pentatricopeptide repeat protein
MTPNTDLSRSLASALGHLGRIEEARQVWRELKEINPRYSYADHFGRLPFRNPAEVDSSPMDYDKRVWRNNSVTSAIRTDNENRGTPAWCHYAAF